MSRTRSRQLCSDCPSGPARTSRRLIHGQRRGQLWLAGLLLLASGRGLMVDEQLMADERPVDFSREVLPILSDRCFHCHGPDAARREGDLRLDLREAAVADRGSGPAIAPGRPEASQLLVRAAAADPELRMPPADSHRKPLSTEELETLTRWIRQGAEWGQHWAFAPPRRPILADLPGTGSSNSSSSHPIDRLIAAQWAISGWSRSGLTFSPETSRRTLIRRLSFDLLGLPPTPAEVNRFLADTSPDAYERLVERLLRSPHHGERLAMWWLDLARYADTDGFQGDADRTNWPWRDWVVESFNRNKPFDQFTLEQFAGDLLPDASPDQVLGTCFHRNHMTNGEGGRDPEESRVDYVIDRINTMGSTWLGLTLGCCQCHSHKFDPISQSEYYQLSAFFNSIDEDGRAGRGAKPYLSYRSPYAHRAQVEAERTVAIRQREEAAARRLAELDFPGWLADQLAASADFRPWRTLHPSSAESAEGTRLEIAPDGIVQAAGENPRQDDYRLVAHSPLPRITGLQLEILPHHSHTQGRYSRGASGEFVLTDVKLLRRQLGSSQVQDIELAGAVADVEKAAQGRNYGRVRDTLDDDPRNGWTTAGHEPAEPHRAVFELAAPLDLAPDQELIFVMLHRSTEGDANVGRFRIAVTDQPGRAVRRLDPMPMELLARQRPATVGEIPADLRQLLLEQYLEQHGPYQEAGQRLELARQQLREAQQAAGQLQVMVLAERAEPRSTWLLERGIWNRHGQQVTSGVPQAILPWTPDQTRSRLDLARWLVDRHNPLTARVVVNQLWQLLFGAGLVRTPGDFGLQGERPTHPLLLDWLAVELMEQDWDLRHVIRLIVTSQAYRQTSQVTPQQLAADPENRRLARGPRFRLPSWMIRDAALRASGLLNPALGGPPVRPYQPAGVWAEMFMGRFRYQPSQGGAQYRRTLYAFWRRSAAPTFLFDSAQRRVCEVRPRRTNTPLHALTLLNDTTQLEAARELARLAISQHSDPDQRLDALCLRVLARTPRPAERSVLRQTLRNGLQHYREHPADAASLLGVGQPQLHQTQLHRAQLHQAQNDPSDQVQLAALMLTASMIFNLDEALTHE